MINISDFKLVEAFLKKACKVRKCGFVDLPIRFSEENDPDKGLFTYDEGVINIGNPNSLGDTMARIIMAYLSNFVEISKKSSTDKIQDIFFDEKHKNLIYTSIVNFFRSLAFSNNSYIRPKSDEILVNRLYQYPFVWVVMKDLVCPSFNSYPVKNSKVVEISSNKFDVCCLGNKNGEDFIVVNNDIECNACIDAHLLYYAIKLQNLDPKEVIKHILDSSLREVFIGILELVYDEDILNGNIRDILFAIMTIFEYENMSEELVDQISKKSIINQNQKPEKTAQFLNPAFDITDNWWFLGLIEKMLEPARGPDWSTYKRLHPYFEKLWNKIEKERAKRGREGLTYEALLRIKDGEIDPDKTIIIEKALASDRVW
jgi:hypothetical protein